MFGGHFYHATIRKSVAVFGTLFNNITVIRKDGSGGILIDPEDVIAPTAIAKFSFNNLE